jgi:hypothetical protein
MPTTLRKHIACGVVIGMAASYSAENAEKDSIKILSDPYIFDLWHDVTKFCDTVLDIPEVEPVLASTLEDMRLIDFVESFTNTSHLLLSDLNAYYPHDTTKIDPFSKPFLRTEFFSHLPMKFDLNNLNQSMTTINMKQLKKDFERDRVIINGNRMIGATTTFEGVIRQVEEILDRNHLNCLLTPLSPSNKRILALQVLKLASRTNSSGIAFEVLRQLLGKSIFDSLFNKLFRLKRLFASSIFEFG